MISLVGRLLAPEDRGLCTVTVDGGRVVAVTDASDAANGDHGGPDAWIVPGLVDLQLNGAFGSDFGDPAADVAATAARLPSTGVTAFLPTLVSSSSETYGPILRNLSQPVAAGGARVLGAHLEGPFLAPTRAGAHELAQLRAPDTEEANAWLDAGDVRIVTVAPELPGALDLVRDLTARGVVMALGHSDARWAVTDAAIAAGAVLGTHLFNAMRPFHHRDPGIVGRLLGEGVAISVVVDGVHVADEVVRLVAGLKGPDEIVFVTDGVAALGEPPGTYALARRDVVSDGASARLADGTLAGSVEPMPASLGRLIAGGLDPEIAVRAASTNPARLVALERELGRIEVGRLADLVVLDANWNPLVTLVAGAVGFERR